jgi:hypothetical protein
VAAHRASSGILVPVTNNRDDDALSWGDEGDPTHIDAPQADTRAARDESGDATPAPSIRRGVAERRERARSERSDEAATATAGTASSTTPSRTSTAGARTGTATDDTTAGPMSSVLLVTLGILAGIYLLYTVGWFTSASRNIALPVGALDVAMAHLREYLSVAAPALWFGTTLLLTRGQKSIFRVLWLVLGVIVLLPLPFVLGY